MMDVQKHAPSRLAALLAAVVAFALGWSMPGGAHAVDKDDRPNIVVVLVDDLRWDELGCLGHPFVKTPHTDRIAREGATFLNAFAATPLCSPNRASLLTGLYAHRHGIIDNTNRSEHSHRLMTFPRVIHEAGYHTGYVGKWHMGNDPTARPGFDYWVSMKGQGACNDPEIYQDGTLKKTSGYVTDILNHRAVAFIRQKRNRPFLLYLAHKAIHPDVTQHDDGSISDPTTGSFTPAERHKQLYAEAEISRRPNAKSGPKGKPALERQIGNLPPLGPETGTDDKTIRDRLRMLAAIDEGVGQLFAALEQTGQLDNTVLVFTSDHGYFYGEHGLSVQRRLAYEEAIRVPLFIRYPPRVRAGSQIEQFTLSVDLAPTLIELAGAGSESRLHGRSLVPLLEGQSPSWRKSFLIECYSDRVFPRMLSMGYKAVRTERYKYINYIDMDGMDELYDLETDPFEMTNLINEETSQATLAEMKVELARLLKETQ